MPDHVHRIHLLTDGGSLCGTLAVIHWTQVSEAVTCPQCRKLLAASGCARGGSGGGAVQKKQDR